jgi:uncharacterized protein
MTHDPISDDPQAADAQFPAANAAVTIDSEGMPLLDVFHLAQGAGPHPAVLLLHGMPGYERNFDLAQVLRRAGWHTLIIHYRGCWGSPGKYSFQHVLDDVRAALAFLRSDRTRETYRIDSSKIVLIGHSLGAFAALTTAREDPDIRNVVSIALFDLGAVQNAIKISPAFSDATMDFFEWTLPPLHGTSAQDLHAELSANGERWHLTQYSHVLAERSLLLIDAARDKIAPPQIHHAPLLRALRRYKAPDVTHVQLETDHAFCDKRIMLARTVVEWLKNHA